MFFFASQGAGAALAYVGAYIIMSYRTFDSFVADKQSLIPASIIIIASVVMVVIGLVGCCATLRESKFGLGCVSICPSLDLLSVCSLGWKGIDCIIHFSLCFNNYNILISFNCFPFLAVLSGYCDSLCS